MIHSRKTICVLFAIGALAAGVLAGPAEAHSVPYDSVLAGCTYTWVGSGGTGWTLGCNSSAHVSGMQNATTDANHDTTLQLKVEGHWHWLWCDHSTNLCYFRS
ncbi:MAG: hypothetical protein ACRDKI_01050 [Solirubrobacterales bacterium]